MSGFPMVHLLGVRGTLRSLILMAFVFAETACTPAGSPPAFYDAATERSGGRAGQLIRFEELPRPPHRSRAYRIVYLSAGRDGTPIPVSGMVIVPTETMPSTGRPVIAWAHPTTGVQPRCAPSLSPLRFVMTPGLAEMVKRGYVVAATDYPGLGTGSVHPFLDGPAEARAVLDIVRASRQLPGTGVNGRFALWGHSQGGQAVLFAAALARTYAPDLQLAGVAAAAPATDLAALFRDDIGSSGGNNLTALTLWAWNREYGADYANLVDPQARSSIATIASKCIDTLVESPEKRAADRSLASGFLKVPDITAIEPWTALIARNSAPVLPAEIPVFLAQGEKDVIVHPEVTAAYAARLCAGGSRVTTLWTPEVGHGWIAAKSANAVVAWLADRFAGAPQVDDCQLQSHSPKSDTAGGAAWNEE